MPAFWTVAKFDANPPLFSHALFAWSILVATRLCIATRFGTWLVAGSAAGFWRRVAFLTSFALGIRSGIAVAVAIAFAAPSALAVGIVATVIVQLTNAFS